MTVGEVISALTLCASDWDSDYLLMSKSVYSIEVKDEAILICFVDGNTSDVSINKRGEIVR